MIEGSATASTKVRAGGRRVVFDAVELARLATAFDHAGHRLGGVLHTVKVMEERTHLDRPGIGAPDLATTKALQEAFRVLTDPAGGLTKLAKAFREDEAFVREVRRRVLAADDEGRSLVPSGQVDGILTALETQGAGPATVAAAEIVLVGADKKPSSPDPSPSGPRP